MGAEAGEAGFLAGLAAEGRCASLKSLDFLLGKKSEKVLEQESGTSKRSTHTVS